MERRRKVLETRVGWIDQVRGFAIILVVLGHVIGGLESLGGGEKNAVRMAIHTFHMPLFFMISGLLAKDHSVLSAKECMHYILKQIISLYIPYLIWGYFFWSVKFFIYSGNESTTLMAGLRLPIDNLAWSPGWFLIALLLVKILDLIFDKVFKDKIFFSIIIWIILAIVASQNKWGMIGEGLRFGMYFEFGKVYIRYIKKEWMPAFLVMFFVGFILKDSLIVTTISGMMMAIGLCMSILMIFQESGSESKLLDVLGADSMIVYTMHAYFTIPARIILQRLNLNNLAIITFAEMTLCICVSFVYIKLVKKSKWLCALYYPLKSRKK